jgi:hypothetical protein
MMAAAPTTDAPVARADGLASRSRRRDHVLDDEDALGRGDRESTSERELAILALREDRAHAKRAADLLAYDDPAECRRQHRLRVQLSHAFSECPAERLRMLRMLEHERALQIAAAVQTRREPEMPFEQRAAKPKKRQNVVRCHFPLRFSSNSFKIRLYSSAQLVSSVNAWFSTGYAASSQFSFLSSMRRCARRTESWKWTFVSTMP